MQKGTIALEEIVTRSGQFNTALKYQLDWLQDQYVTTVTTSGTYRVFAFDVPALTAGQYYALKVRKDYDRNYWAEFRQKYANPWFLNGVILNWDPWNNGLTNSKSGTHLLDTTPGTPTANSSKADSAVVIGRTFSDMAAGIHLTPLAKGNSTPENWIDVQVKETEEATRIIAGRFEPLLKRIFEEDL